MNSNNIDFHTRRNWFDNYRKDILAGKREPPEYVFGLTCPCCGYPMLDERNSYEICMLCWWEDDGTDEDDLNRVSGPNHITLADARANFEESFMCDEKNGVVVPGMNDAMANENKKRITDAFDNIVRATTTNEVNDLLSIVSECLTNINKELKKQVRRE